MSEGNEKRKFNIIDAAVLLILAAAVVLAVVMFFPFSGASAKTEAVTVKIKIYKSDEALAELIEESVGEEIFIGSSGEYSGTLLGVSYETAKELAYVEDSLEYVYTYYPEAVDITVELSLECTVTDTAITFEGTELRLGTALRIATKSYSVAGNVISTDDGGGE
ncbi:MAG: DUF4330 domain-containing protein [Firmicutes bacterium]|nr:DUF4330 domain-containing protein [Bacillota bacterium]MCD7783360.1 DUF4330 domain-containing protein [Bacillota bacterium]